MFARKVLLAAIAAAATLVACGSDPPYKPTFQWNGGKSASVPTRVVFENHMGEGFRLKSLRVALDGAPVYERSRGSDEGEDPFDKKELVVWNGSADGDARVIHTNVVYKGHGYGVFAYISGYEFKVESEHTSFPKGPAFDVRIVGYEKGGPTTPIEERPALRFIDRVVGEDR